MGYRVNRTKRMKNRRNPATGRTTPSAGSWTESQRTKSDRSVVLC